MENENRLDWVWEMFETEPELFIQVYQLLNAGIREAVNGSMVVTEVPPRVVLDENRKLVHDPEPNLNSKDCVTMRELGRPSRVMSSLLQGKMPSGENDQAYLEGILAGFGKKLNP
ncbi:MAG: hypothetical protein ABII80_03215 [bacterium]